MTLAASLLPLRRLRAQWRSGSARRARLRATEAAVGRTLTRAERRLVRAYAHDVLGDVGYAPELGRYLLVAGGFREGWIPPSFFRHAVVPYLHPLLAKLTPSRSFKRHLLPLDAFPDRVTLVHGAFFDRAGARLNAVEAHATLFADASEALMRLDRGGAARIVRSSDDLAALAGTSNAVFQRVVPAHPALAAIASDDATLQLTTVLLPAAAMPAALAMAAPGAAPAVAAPAVVMSDAAALPEGVSLRAALLRDPTSASSPYVAVDVRDATTQPRAFDRDGRAFERHPLTGAPFGPTAVPGFAAAAALAAALHAHLPHAAVVRWDVRIDPDERAFALDFDVACPSPAPTEPLSGPAFADLGWERLRPPPSDALIVVRAEDL